MRSKFKLFSIILAGLLTFSCLPSNLLVTHAEDYTKEQMAQVTNPTADFVVQRLSLLSFVSGVGVVTEDHDPNGHLNKQGGYTAAVYFSSPAVQLESYEDTGDIIDTGTVGGGCIEVYKTAEDANSRNDYLAAFDGSILSSGSHYVIGTIVIRTSDKLTATQQNEATAAIIYNLTAIV